MKKLLYILIVIFTSLASYAEGTKELGDFSADFGGIYLSDEVWYSQFGQYDAGKPYQITISITDPSETIYYGLNARLPDGTSPAPFPYRILDPAGNVVFSSNTPDVGNIGYIDTYANNLLGPKLNPTDPGYDALIYQPLDSGEYAIEFNPDLASADPRMILRFFDVTVRDSLDQVKLGRLHSQSWQLSTGCFSCPINTSLFPYHPNGVVYELETNGLIPFAFTFNFNSTGTDTSGVFSEDRKSRVGKYDYPEFEVFLNAPDEDIFPSNESNIEYNASFQNNGCESSLFCLDFTNSSVGVVNGFLDFNNNNLFEPELGDVSFEDIVDSTGSTCIEWDGIDANGNEVGVGEINLVTRFGSGIIHLPLYDIEHNRNGYKISTLKPSALPDPTIFWDDAALTVGNTLGSPLVELDGCQSDATTGCHKWEGRGALTGDRNLQETINTWWFSEIRFDTVVFNYVPNTPVEVSFNPDTLIQDVNPLCIGDSVNIFVFNNRINHYDTSRYNYEWYRETISGTPLALDSNSITIVPSTETNIILRSIFKDNPICFSSDTITVQTTSLFSTNVIINDENCLANTASASVSFQSEFLNPTIYWNEFPEFNGNSRDNLTAGEYTITVVDSTLSISENCFFDTTFTVEANKLIDIIDVSEDSTSCYDTTGTLEVTMANPSIVYQYSWNGGPFTTSDSILKNLPSGNYSVVVRDSLRGCTVDTTTLVKPIFFNINASTNNEFCTDASGNISLTAPNTNKLTIEWADSPTNDLTRTGLTAGTYNFSIFSSLTPGCRVDTSFVISDSVPVFSSLDLSFEKNSLAEDLPFICDNDTVTFFITSDGDSHYNQTLFTYNWYRNLSGTVLSTNTDSLSLQESNDYSITIEALLNENTNCRYYDTLSISTTPPLDATLEVIDTICVENRAEALLTIVPSVHNPVVTWNEFSGFNGLSRTDLSSGTYTITVRDDNYSDNCSFDTTFTVDANKKITIQSLEEDNTACYDSTANIGIEMVENGINYVYSWNGAPFTSENNLSNVPAGNYNVVARDPINGCEIDTVIPVLAEPIEIDAFSINEFCTDTSGRISISVPDTDKLTIEWNDILTPDIVRSDLTAGTYDFSIFSNLTANCRIDTSFIITDSLPTVSSLDLSFDKTNLVRNLPFVCDNDTVTFFITSDGASHYDQGLFTYNWYRNTSTQIIETNTSSINIADTSNYSITIEALLNENTNCRYYDTLSISTAPPLDATLEVIDTICVENRAEATLTIVPSVYNPVVTWNEFSGFNGLSRTDLSSGTYTITVRDDNYSDNCSFDTTFTVDANKKITIQSLEEDNTACYDSTANIGIEMVENGINYVYSWNGAPFTSENNLSDVPAGNYNVVARDPINGCEIDTVIPVLAEPIEIEIDVVNASCDRTLGQIVLGIPSEKLTVEWLDINTNDTERINLEAGNYSFEINTGIPNCEVDTTINVLYLDRPVSIKSLDIMDTDCANPTGKASVEINPFQEDLIYLVSWDNGNTFGGQFSRTNLSEGLYEVVIRENGTDCMVDTSFLITAEKTALEINQTNTICTSNSGSLQINTTNSNFSVTWADDNTNNELSRDSLPQGAYTYMLTHNTLPECNYNGTINILQSTNVLEPEFSIEGFTGIEGAYLDEEVNFINESNPTPIVRWTVEEDIIYNTNNASHTFTQEGEQLVVLYIEDEFGCSAEKRQPLVVKRHKECKMVMPNAFSPNCDGINETIGPLGEADEMELKIYNRWGELVFRSIEQTERWDGIFLGQPAPVAIYVYQLDYSCNDLRGNTTKENETGEITLVR